MKESTEPKLLGSGHYKASESLHFFEERVKETTTGRIVLLLIMLKEVSKRFLNKKTSGKLSQVSSTSRSGESRS